MLVHRLGRDLSRGDAMLAPMFFKEPGEKSVTGSSIVVDDQAEDEEKAERILLCKQCDAGIARDKDRLSRDGKHLHTFFNPAGIVYEIGCFRQAPGCAVDDLRSNEFSWFADYSWQISFCGACSKHLGWFFSSADDSFFGLIINRLRGG